VSRALLFPVLAAALLLLGAMAPRAVVAAEKSASCGSVIVSLPATIDTPGSWCLTANLTTNIVSGNAIAIAANNVVLDCNGFRIDGYGAGDTSSAVGISATGRRNITIRNCEVRGFLFGAYLDDQSQPTSGRHLVEDNVFNQNHYVGVYVGGDGSTVRRNQVLQTQAPASGGAAFALETSGVVDIVDNTIYHVEATDAAAIGILTNFNVGGTVRGNRIAWVGLDSGTGPVLAMRHQNASARMTIRGNVLSGDASAGSIGIECNTTTDVTKSNSILGWDIAISECANNGNTIKP
jgi:hypothetical protein